MCGNRADEPKATRRAGKADSVLMLGAWAILAFAAADGSRAAEQSGPAVVPDEVAVKPPACGPATALQEGEHGLWEGEWVMKGSKIADESHSILRIRKVDSEGFAYETECRDVPSGTNAYWSGEKRARFESAVAACTPEPETRFRLRVDPDDRHARTLEMEPLQCSHTDTPGNVFVFERTVFRAGFDCALAATPVEHAICGNELIARGDFEASELYRGLRNTLPEDQALELRNGQRAWLRLRNDRCTSGEAADETCLARLYGDRLVGLARLKDPHLGVGEGFDSAYALARIVRGTDLRLDTAARLAMYPLAMDPAGEVNWRADPDELLFEQAYVDTRTVWPGEVEFRYSDLLYVGRDGTVWTVEHVDTTAPPPPDSGIRADRLWAEAGRDPLAVRTEAGSDAPYPPAVAHWLDERGAADSARPGVVDVCGRTPQVRDAIVRATGVANCEAVTGQDLAGIDALHLRRTGIETLREGDFAGISGLESLDLRDNALTMLSEEVFAGLSSLQSLDVEDNPGSPFDLSLRRTDSWCTVQQPVFINFRSNGRTVSICEDKGTLTYFAGHLDAEPELRYSGSLLASLGGSSVNALELPYRNLADLAGWMDDPAERELLKELACATTTNGFIEIKGLTGFSSSRVYVFRNGGWQYEVGGEWGRTFNVPAGTDEYEELANHEEYRLTTRSPEEQDYCLN